MGMENEVIYDFETLSQEFDTGPVVSMSLLSYDEGRFASDNPYTYSELLGMAHLIKFKVEEQVKKYGRKIQMDTLEWWGGQSEEAQKQLKPSDKDQSITELYSFIVVNTNLQNLQRVFTRGNTFDPMFLKSILKAVGKDDPFPWWLVRDTRSYIEGMLQGSEVSNNSFIPKELESKFVHHDPIHDVVMDVMRMQILKRAIVL